MPRYKGSTQILHAYTSVLRINSVRAAAACRHPWSRSAQWDLVAVHSSATVGGSPVSRAQAAEGVPQLIVEERAPQDIHHCL